MPKTFRLSVSPWVAFAFLLTGHAAALAQTPKRPVPCSRPEFRQFDFWLGDWDVTTPDAGTVSEPCQLARMRRSVRTSPSAASSARSRSSRCRLAPCGAIPPCVAPVPRWSRWT